MAHDFEFTLTFPGDEPEADIFGPNNERLDALFEAGCNDGTASSCGRGTMKIYFTRDGDLLTAVSSALANVRQALPDAQISMIEFYY